MSEYLKSQWLETLKLAGIADSGEKQFSEITDDQKDNILKELAAEAQTHKGDNPHIFDLLRDMTTYGFFTSEIGKLMCIITIA